MNKEPRSHKIEENRRGLLLISSREEGLIRVPPIL